MEKRRIFVFIIIFIYGFCFAQEKNKIDYSYKIDIFVKEGFGCRFPSNEVYGYDILSQFGKIKSITKTFKYNKNSILLEFESIKLIVFDPKLMELNNKNKFNEEIFNNLRIWSIYAQENIEYMFGVKIGMSFQDFINIFGGLNYTDEQNNSYFRFVDNNSNEFIAIKKLEEELNLDNAYVLIYSKDFFYKKIIGKTVKVDIINNKINYIQWLF
jgi:hypothetical protein